MDRKKEEGRLRKWVEAAALLMMGRIALVCVGRADCILDRRAACMTDRRRKEVQVSVGCFFPFDVQARKSGWIKLRLCEKYHIIIEQMI